MAAPCVCRLNAFIISQNSLRFLVPFPWGLVNTDWINLRNPSCTMKTFYFEKFHQAVAVSEGTWKVVTGEDKPGFNKTFASLGNRQFVIMSTENTREGKS